MEAKYDNIGKDYNLTRKADPFITKQLLRCLAPNKNGCYLDIGCGTGNYTIVLQENGLQFIGMDPSIEMLKKAKFKNASIDWRIGSVEHIKLPDASINGIVASLTIHHWRNLKEAFKALYRVLKPNGRMVIFTSTPKQMKGYWLNHYFPNMMEDSIIQMPDTHALNNAIEDCGFRLLELEKYFIKPDLEDNFLYCGKHNPKIYFNEQIRQGISSFSSLANKVEVKKGLSELHNDIESEHISNVIKAYDNDFGDYMFVTVTK